MKTIREHVRECAYREIEMLKKKYSYDLSLFRIAERAALRDNDKTFDEVLRIVAIAKDYGLDFSNVQQKTDNWAGKQRRVQVWFKTDGVLGIAKNKALINIRKLIEQEVAKAIDSKLKHTKVGNWCNAYGDNPIALIQYTKYE